MATSRSRANTLYGYPNPQANQFPAPLVMRRDPTGYDDGEIGQMWINTLTNVAYALTSRSAGVSTWSTSIFGGVVAPVFTVNPGDLTVTAGNVIISAGNLDVTAGGITAGGNIVTVGNIQGADITATGALNVTANSIFQNDLAVQGDLNVTGTLTAGVIDIDSIINANKIQIESTFNGADAILIDVDGGTNETLHLQSKQGTGLGSVLIESLVGGIILSSGRNNATAILFENTNAAGGMFFTTGTGGLLVETNGGPLTLNSDVGTIAISNDNAATTINIGTAAAVVKTIAIGGTGANVITIANTQTAGSLSLGAGMTTGTINIGGTGLQTGTVNIAVGTGVQTINLGTGGTGVKSINIGTGAVANNIVIGSTTGAADTIIRAGTGGISLVAGGFVQVDPGTDTQASPSATAVINSEVFKATFTGFTTASAASQVFIITNASIAATSGILVSAATLGGNDAQMTVTRVLPGAGTVSITLTNNGAQAVNGNIIITGWVIN